jgi:hypothetical protein
VERLRDNHVIGSPPEHQAENKLAVTDEKDLSTA